MQRGIQDQGSHVTKEIYYTSDSKAEQNQKNKFSHFRDIFQIYLAFFTCLYFLNKILFIFCYVHL